MGEEKRKNQRYFTMFMSELIATGLLMFLGCMGCATQADNPPAVHHMTSLAFGLVVMLIIQSFGHISGAHLNPGVTIAALIFGLMKPVMAIVYIAAQFLGALLGFGLLRILMPDEWVKDGFCVTKPNFCTTGQALGIEIIITAVLIIVCGAVWDSRNSAKQESVPLRFGFVIVAISMVAGPLTGASMNSARSLPPVLFWGNYDGHWIYWVGPNLGAVLGCLIYKTLFSVTNNDDDNIEKDEVIHLEDADRIITEKV